MVKRHPPKIQPLLEREEHKTERGTASPLTKIGKKDPLSKSSHFPLVEHDDVER